MAEIDWLRIQRAWTQMVVPSKAKGAHAQVFFQAVILDASIRTYIGSLQYNPSAGDGLTDVARNIAAARSVAHEAALFIKFARAFINRSQRTNLSVLLDQFQLDHPHITDVRDAFSHLDERVTREDTEPPSPLFRTQPFVLASRTKLGNEVEMKIDASLINSALNVLLALSREYQSR
ncbi:hypothetical protein [uncultured Brevundimonas sp.]|uniref:hypothetical protein n=1 Tax=uncultured Brevundimonas sp. TaxID=213418 RepID=UPI00260DBFFB|nr:hypothetical protein [uncultured Brevundimonas sp.]